MDYLIALWAVSTFWQKIIFGAFIGAIVGLIFVIKDRVAAKKEIEQQNQALAMLSQENNDPDVAPFLPIIFECISLAEKSNDIDSSIIQYNMAKNHLTNIIQKFPDRLDWQSLLLSINTKVMILEETQKMRLNKS